MKKLFLLLVCVCVLASCSDDEKSTPDPTPSLIIGEWVYDDLGNGIWEKQKFLSNMKFYLSYITMYPYETQENAEGTYYYTEGSKKFTFTYQNVLGGITYQDAVIEDINDYFYTASYYNDDNTFSGRYTYHKLIGNVNLSFDESCIPQYNKMIPNAVIKEYKSNNEELVVVNSSTGEITTKSKAGRTYINVITDNGIAYVEVNVVDPVNLFPDYSSALNMNEEEVKKQWPNFCIHATPIENCVYYPIIANDYAEMAMIWLDDNKNVESVQISVKTTVKDEDEREAEIHEYLSGKYEYQSLDNGTYMYFDMTNPQILPMAVYYSPKINLIEYQKIIFNDLWEDYTQNFGKTFNELKQKYGEPFYQTTTSQYFSQENSYIEFVAFSLSDDKVYTASAFLKADCDWQEALNFINRIYYYYEKGSDVSNRYFAFTNKKSLAESNIGSTFDGKNGLITYVDLTANSSSLAVNKKIVAEIKNMKTIPSNQKALVIIPKWNK